MTFNPDRKIFWLYQMKRVRYHTIYFAAIALSILLIINLAGCTTSTTLTNGASLAKAGQTAAAQMQQNVTLSGDSILQLKKAVAFNDGYNNMVGNTNSQVFLANIQSIQGKLTQYGNWLQSLSSSYSALGDLAGYDASGNFDSSITSLAGDTTNFANGIGKPIAIPADVTSGVKAIGGILIGAEQAGEVKRASRSIECILTNVITMLEDPNTKQQMVAIHEDVTGQIDQAAEVLIYNGIGSYSPLLNELGAPLGITATSNSDEIVKTNKQMLAGLMNVEIESVNQQISAQESNYDQSLSALKALVTLHESLQKGSPITLTTITNITSQLQAIASQFGPTQSK